MGVTVDELRILHEKADCFDKILSFAERIKSDPKSLHCSFCGKHQNDVMKLVAGPNVYICDECIELCTEIVEEELEGTFIDGDGI